MRPHRCILLLQIVFGKSGESSNTKHTHNYTMQTFLFFFSSLFSVLYLSPFFVFKSIWNTWSSFYWWNIFLFFTWSQRWPPKSLENVSRAEKKSQAIILLRLAAGRSLTDQTHAHSISQSKKNFWHFLLRLVQSRWSTERQNYLQARVKMELEGKRRGEEIRKRLDEEWTNPFAQPL